MWSDTWVGLPYRLGGRGPEYDCMGLWLALRRLRFGDEVPDSNCDQREALRGRAFATMRPSFADVETAVEGDLILFRHSRRCLHVGYALGAKDMLHTSSAIGHSLIERFDSVKWRPSIVGIYRYGA